MRQARAFHRAPRRFDRLHEFFLPAEMLQIAIGGFVAIAQLIQIGSNALQASVQRFQFFILRGHCGFRLSH